MVASSYQLGSRSSAPVENHRESDKGLCRNSSSSKPFSPSFSFSLSATNKPLVHLSPRQTESEFLERIYHEQLPLLSALGGEEIASVLLVQLDLEKIDAIASFVPSTGHGT
jgi:hypothetical protein